ncbi:hypothetical protein CLHUN_24740 [Ruminiclostridium hungatei]|uniref:Uncharacterized protein n=1 Tax=Ruminiclostridium hungatei TaxID=48256 RepID=A0A1V4SJW1_RUMHU|nr:hypothetical protein [Ruminiclostridium hungatei]OPX43537.1 hypothetical protein CLHUN_24740 [Ruminiclostridium hungatei]
MPRLRGNAIQFNESTCKLTPEQIAFREQIDNLYYDGYYEKLYKVLKSVTGVMAGKFISKWGYTYKLELDDVIAECNLRLCQLIDGGLAISDNHSFYDS